MKLKVMPHDVSGVVEIKTIAGAHKLRVLGAAKVASDDYDVYELYYTDDGNFILSMPPSIFKITDVIKVSELFNETYGKLAEPLKKTLLPAMAIAAGYTDVRKFVTDKLIEFETIDCTKGCKNQLYDGAFVVIGKLGKRKIEVIWRKIDTPTVPTLNRAMPTEGLYLDGEKEFLQKTWNELIRLPLKDWPEIEEYSKRYLTHIILANLERYGLL